MAIPLIIYGTRPEYIKLKPIMKAFDAIKYPYEVIQIGQHDSNFIGENTHSRIVLCGLDVINRLNIIQYNILQQLLLYKNKYNLVIVHGDTATSFASTLNAFNSGIPVAHIEAGLRTRDIQNPYPEEMYRQLTDRITTLHFCPRYEDFHNLRHEFIDLKNAHVVGNTVIDNLPDVEPMHENEVYITMHRRENKDKFKNWFNMFSLLVRRHKNLNFKFIRHPSNEIENPDLIEVIEPVSHEEMIKILADKAKVIITDSGGLQEECSHYNKPVIVCRKVTERPYNGMRLCREPLDLIPLFNEVKDLKLNTRGTFGDGNSGKKIVDIIVKWLNGK